MKSSKLPLALPLSALFLQSSIFGAFTFPDQDHDGFHDAIEQRYGSPSAWQNSEQMPRHGAPLRIGQVAALDPEQRFPDVGNAVAIDAGGFDSRQFVLVLKGDGRVAVWSAGVDSVEALLFDSNQWQGTHPRLWRDIVAIEVAPFGLFGVDANGQVSACGETWAVNAVEAEGELEMIETSYDSLIGLRDDGSIFTVVNGWADPADAVVPVSVSEVATVAAGLNTFWAIDSQGDVTGWGESVALSQMDASSIPPDGPDGNRSIVVSPLSAAGVVISSDRTIHNFGDANSGFGQGARSDRAVQTPGDDDSFSFLDRSFRVESIDGCV